jgi:hypothetical protein
LALELDAQFDIISEAYDACGGFMLDYPSVSWYAMIGLKNIAPSVIQDRYTGFNNRWDHDFNHLESVIARTGIELQKLNFNFDASFIRLENYIAMISDADSGYASIYPVQYTDLPLRILQLQLKQDFTLGQFHLDNRIAWQMIADHTSSGRDAPIVFPELVTQHSFYYQRHLFKSALFTKIGIDAWYASSYYGYKYNPINGQFGNQAGSDESNYQLLTFYPVFDIFANFDIRTFRFFLKVDNVAQGLFSNGYFEAPQYPMQPRGVKLGVNWMLFY